MKKSLSGLLVIAVSFMFLAGCATVKVEAPSGQSIMLQTSVDSQMLVMKKKSWYLLWGLVPISKNSTADFVKNENLKEMSCKTYIGVDDFFISAIGSYLLGLCTRTVEIKGK